MMLVFVKKSEKFLPTVEEVVRACYDAIKQRKAAKSKRKRDEHSRAAAAHADILNNAVDATMAGGAAADEDKGEHMRFPLINKP